MDEPESRDRATDPGAAREPLSPAKGATPAVEAARWRRVEAALDGLLDCADAGARAERLAALEAEDPALALEASRLLEAARATDGDLLEAPLVVSLPALIEGLVPAPAEETPELPREIDRYRLLGVLGRGGMGVVYLAERADREFDKQVALKLMPRGLETPDKERRFRAERQILARLEHPGIARLLDGGVTSEGYPYLVLERVEGEPIDRYCESRSLPLRERLALFLEVCAAVEYAHANLVVHRDLKPGNIFVDAQGRVKLLDFGIAKMLDESDDGDLPTRLPLLTPDYASPEQLANRPVSTVSDVYSLGVLLYRLVAGVTPARLRRDAASGAPTAAPAAPGPPPPPSRAAAHPATRARAAAVDREARRLSADLDLVALKALEPDPGRRYGSASALAEDLRRLLEGRPVSARPATRRYRAAKFVERHRTGTLAAAALVLLLVAGVAAVVWQARVAAAERDRARVEAARAERVAEFVGGLFEAASPTSAGAGRSSLREILDEGERHLRSELGSEPAVRGKLLEVLAGAYSALGDTERGRALAEEAVSDLRRADPDDGPALAGALVTLAAARIAQGELDGVEAALDEAGARLEAAGLARSRAMARCLRNRGVLARLRADEQVAEALHRHALELWRELGDSAEAAVELVSLAGRMDALGRPDEGLALKLEALETLRGVYGDDHPHVFTVRNNIGFSLHTRGRYGEAEAVYREVLARSEALLGPEHPGLADALTNLGKVLIDQGRFAEAAPHVRRAARLRRLSVDENHFARIATEINLASLELALGAVGEAVALYRGGLERLERLAGAESAAATRVRSLLGVALHRAGDPAGAEPLLRTALERQRAGGRPLDLADTLVGLGAVASDLGRGAEALELLDEALDLRLTALATDHWSIAEARIERAGALLRLGRHPEARAELEGAAPRLAAGPGPDWARRRAARFAAALDAGAAG